jgi:hypothetical protein
LGFSPVSTYGMGQNPWVATAEHDASRRALAALS